MTNKMKRSDRQVTDQNDIDAIIYRCRVCRLAMFDGKESYIVPMNFGYNDKTVYVHGAQSGRKIDILTSLPQVCVEFDRTLDMVTDEETACRWSQKFESVIAWGKAEFLTAAEEKREALNIIMGKYTEGYTDKKEWLYEDALLKRTQIIKIPLDRMTGKQYL